MICTFYPFEFLIVMPYRFKQIFCVWWCYTIIIRISYDKRRHSYKFDGQQQLNVVWLFDFDDLPEAFKNYITMRAANLFAGRSVGSAEQVKFGEREEMQARAAMMEYETQQGDYNMLGTVDNMNYRTYRPAMASIRY